MTALQAALARSARAESLAAAAKRYAESVIEAVHGPILVLDAQLTVRSANPAFFDTFAERAETTIGRRIFGLGNGQWDIAPLRSLLEEVLPASQRIDGFELTRCFEGVGRKIIRINARQIYQDGIGTQTILLAMEDVTLRRQLEERLLAASLTDELTGLYNRRGLFTLGSKLLHMAARQGKGLRALYLDLDGLKAINDRCGHEEGDLALADTAQILRETYRESDVIARIGGDEFVVLSVGADEAGADAVLARLQAAAAEQGATQQRRFAISLSAGIAHCTAGTPCAIGDLLRRADEALYEAKRARAEALADADRLSL